MKTVVRKMQKRRVQEELSLRALAPIVGVSFSTLSRLERGGTPDVATAAKIETWLAGKSIKGATKKDTKKVTKKTANKASKGTFTSLTREFSALRKRFTSLEARFNKNIQELSRKSS